jgi:hypothetical protein
VTVVSLAVPASAGKATPGEERILEAARRIERTAAPLGEAPAVARLARAFRVPPLVVTDLRDQKLDFGEVAVILAMAEAGAKSPDTILSLWASGRLDWGEIADRLQVDRRTVLRRLDTTRRALTGRGR